MSTFDLKQRLTDEIRSLEAEFRARRADARPLARSVAAAYRRSIEQRADQLKSLDRSSH